MRAIAYHFGGVLLGYLRALAKKELTIGFAVPIVEAKLGALTVYDLSFARGALREMLDAIEADLDAAGLQRPPLSVVGETDAAR